MNSLGGLLAGNVNADVRVNVAFDLLSSVALALFILIAIVLGTGIGKRL